ncbi:transcription factor bHLH150 [Iris pallida]|uniref:Transcription factor bHLH150 n=1 Tax=Iris pallida TaxID=29817 RepID=A0AAX6G8F5_IRIPA|nr:transcription factor bHLH150 [Iris pallida]
MLSSPSSSSGSKKPKPDPGAKKNPAHNKWKTPGQQRIYKRRLLDALRSPQPAAGATSARSIKQAADSALALTAHGQSRWSRAILSARHLPRRRVLLKASARSRRPPPKKDISAKAQLEEQQPTKDVKVNDRLRRLGRLVPGCRKLAAPRMLEEAADYVAALEMQVRTMRMLVESMSAAALSPPVPPTDGELEREPEPEPEPAES